MECQNLNAFPVPNFDNKSDPVDDKTSFENSLNNQSPSLLFLNSPSFSPFSPFSNCFNMSPLMSPITFQLSPLLNTNSNLDTHSNSNASSNSILDENVEKDNRIMNPSRKNENYQFPILNMNTNVNTNLNISMNEKEANANQENQMHFYQNFNNFPLNVSKEQFLQMKKNQNSNQRKKRHQNFPKELKKKFDDWLLKHWAYPYPTVDEINRFSLMSGLTKRQIRIYFTNQRARLLGRQGLKSNRFKIYRY